MSLVSELERPVAKADATALTITPLQPTIGAEISGLDLRQPLSDGHRDQIKAALLKHKVVFFRDQPIDREQQLAFGRRFGPIYTPPYTPDRMATDGLHLIAADPKRERAEDAAARPDQIRDGYHSDTNWRIVPSWGAILRAVTIPPVGGDTLWVDAGLAYRELPEDVKARLEGLHAVVDFQSALKRAGHDYPIVAHPVVRPHRETGEKILWVDFGKRPQLIGVSDAENRELLQIILDQYRKPEYQVRFSWKPGSIAFWDNRGAVHYAVRNYGDFPRAMERVLIDDEPLWRDL